MKEVESALGFLQASIVALRRRGDDELALAYPLVKDKVADAEDALTKLGMYEAVRDAIGQSELLVRDKRLREAEDLICDTARALMERSGTHKDLERLYKPKTSQSNGRN